MMHFHRAIKVLFVAASFVCASLSHADAREAWRAYLVKDYARAVDLAQAPAQEGDKDAQYIMGLAVKHGRGAQQNHEAALSWFKLAAERGHADALNDLATCYSRGEGVARDDAKAFEYFLKAAERGSAAGQHNAAKHYEQGIGTPKDFVKARFWLEKSDASVYRNEVRRTQSTAVRVLPPIKSLPNECRPKRLPAAAMVREKVNQVSGNLHAFVDADRKFRGITAADLTEEALRFEVVALFSEALRAPACKAENGFTEAAVVIPFRFQFN